MTGDTAIPRSDPPCDSSQLGRAQPPGREASGATGVEAAVDVAVSDVVSDSPGEHPVDGAVVGVCSCP